jgi:hypothetical protein
LEFEIGPDRENLFIYIIFGAQAKKTEKKGEISYVKKGVRRKEKCM